MAAPKEALIKELISVGLTDKEAKVYLAVLAYKQASVQRIAKHSEIKRVTTYVILESLMDMGLVSKSTRNNKTEFLAEDTGNLQRLLEQRKNKLDDQKKQLEKLLPELKRMQQLPEKFPEIKYFVGKEPLKSLFEEGLKQLLKSHDTDIYTVTSYDRRRELFKPGDFDDFIEKRKKIPVRGKQLYTGKIIGVFADPKLNEYRELEGPIEADLNLYKEQSIVVSYQDPPIGILIADERITKTLRNLFEFAWEHAGEHSVNRNKRGRKSP